MRKTLIGPRLRQLRREHKQTQSEMAKALNISAAYVNQLEHNQRSLSVQMLMSLSDTYGIDFRDLIKDESANILADLRNTVRDPIFRVSPPDLQELRAAIDHAPKLVTQFLHLYKSHRSTLESMMRLGAPDDLLASTPETIVHDFFRNNANHFPELEVSAERLRSSSPCDADDVYANLKMQLRKTYGITVCTAPVEEMSSSLRIYDEANAIINLSEALDHQNRVFQLAHVLCLVELPEVLNNLTTDNNITLQTEISRCHVELANYFAAAYLMPYEDFLQSAEHNLYDVDRLAASFGVSFEQVCHRLTTLQREGAKGVPFFFLRVDKAGNVTKRFNATSFNIAEYGGACPVWNIHTSFRTPGVIIPQFLELPEGEKYFTISRTSERPVFSRDTQDQQVALSLGCELKHAKKLTYTTPFKTDADDLFSPIGINCQLCPRQACSQRAHHPLFTELTIDTNRRGNTRYES
jgi:predicted transcriptional regulator/transcriptional regulator with XRE-family HTH domain